jgi:Sulfotransferase family
MKSEPPVEAASENSQPVTDPVFILGMHRSGTTLLYEMMACLEQWNTLWAWHVACYDEIREGKTEQGLSLSRFSEHLRKAGIETRGVDAIKAGPETKEEYCFIMENHGYDNKLSRAEFSQFQELCATVQSTYSQQRPLLLKNPWDFGNAHVIRELIPSARFVYIHRHPVETINSMFRLLRGVLKTPNTYLETMSRRYRRVANNRWKKGLLNNTVQHLPGPFIDGLIWWFGRHCDDYLASIGRIPESARVEVTYDELCAQPNETMARIRQHFDLPDNDTDFSSMIKIRNSECDRRVVAKLPKIKRRMRAYLVRHARSFCSWPL